MSCTKPKEERRGSRDEQGRMTGRETETGRMRHTLRTLSTQLHRSGEKPLTKASPQAQEAVSSRDHRGGNVKNRIRSGNAKCPDSSRHNREVPD